MMDYDLWADVEYVDIQVFYAVRQREWRMSMYRDRQTMRITTPLYEYAPTRYDDFEEVSRLPKRVQAYFDSIMNKAQTLLILKDDQ